MQMFLYILVAVVFFSLMDLVPAAKEHNHKLIYLYLGMMTAVLVVWVLLAKGVDIPGPNAAIRAAIESIVGPQN